MFLDFHRVFKQVGKYALHHLQGLPKSSTGEPAAFKGWPRLEWCVTEHLTKPPKDWQPSPRHADSSTAYIEYYVDKEGSMKGVAVTRQSLVSHSRALTAACGYTEGRTAYGETLPFFAFTSTCFY